MLWAPQQPAGQSTKMRSFHLPGGPLRGWRPKVCFVAVHLPLPQALEPQGHGDMRVAACPPTQHVRASPLHKSCLDGSRRIGNAGLHLASRPSAAVPIRNYDGSTRVYSNHRPGLRSLFPITIILAPARGPCALRTPLQGLPSWYKCDPVALFQHCDDYCDGELYLSLLPPLPLNKFHQYSPTSPLIPHHCLVQHPRLTHASKWWAFGLLIKRCTSISLETNDRTG